jgi:hypothetical protein
VPGVRGDRPDVSLTGCQHAEVADRAGAGDVLPDLAVRIGPRVEGAVGRRGQAPDETAVLPERVQPLHLARRRVEAVEVGHRVRTDIDLAAGHGGGPAALRLTHGRSVGERDAPDDLAGGQVDVRQYGRFGAAFDDVGVSFVDDGADDRAGDRCRPERLHPRAVTIGGYGGGSGGSGEQCG